MKFDPGAGQEEALQQEALLLARVMFQRLPFQQSTAALLQVLLQFRNLQPILYYRK